MNILKQWLPIFKRYIRIEAFSNAFVYNLLALNTFIQQISKNYLFDNKKYFEYFHPQGQDKRALQEYRIDKEKELKNIMDETSMTIYTSRHGIVHHKIVEIEHHPQDEYDIIAKTIVEAVTLVRFGDLGLHLLLTKGIEEYRKWKINTPISQRINDYWSSMAFEGFEWDIRITFQDSFTPANEVLYSLWTFVEALSQIEDVSLYIQDWGKGSFWAQIKAIFKSEAAKEEVKQILENVKDGIMAEKVQKPIEEVNKIKAQTEKLNKESDIIETKEERKESRDLDMDIKRLERDGKALENKHKEADLMDKKLDLLKKISAFAKEGLTNDSDLQMMINDVLFIGREDGKYLNNVGSMDDIEKNELKIYRKKQKGDETTGIE
ncbi:hypothetical protein [uncultured Microscilla sp.]|uniref:hypothetical protein n=1 Tax=uncultured Microscilla sp. TaxID=432653 RepID=UPI00261C776F|nr:hypothetical protein [uncultured Microscilla sp.]